MILAGKRWRAFKTQLTTRYIFGKKKNESPVGVYEYLDEETWQKFVESRMDPAFLVSLFVLLVLCFVILHFSSILSVLFVLSI